MFHHAMNYRQNGISVIPLSEGSKKPPKGFDWKEFTTRLPTLGEIRCWFDVGTRNNIGLVMGRVSGLVAVDGDTKTNARALWRALPKTELMTSTPNGGHLIYATSEEIRPRVKAVIQGIQCDIRGEESYVVGAPSIHPTGSQYEQRGSWQRNGVPSFHKSWIQEPAMPSRPNFAPTSTTKMERASRYLAKVEGAVSGQQGHNRTLYAASCLVQKFELSIEESWPLMLEYNARCEPPWSEKDLLRKLQEAERLRHA